MSAGQTLDRYDGQACPRCGEWFEVYVDSDGIWVECDCDAGYLS